MGAASGHESAGVSAAPVRLQSEPNAEGLEAPEVSAQPSGFGDAVRQSNGALLLALAFVLGGGVLIANVISTSFAEGDRAVPFAFIAVELVLASFFLFRLSLGRETLADALDYECDLMEQLARDGSVVGDALVYLSGVRREAIGAVQETSAGGSNFLIVAGMIGTAGYLVWHSADFVLQHDSDLTSSLGGLLSLAPKAFAATGLALWCAVFIGVFGSVVVGRANANAATTEELLGAWRDGRSVASLADTNKIADAMRLAIDERLVQRLEALPRELRAATDGTQIAVQEMRATVGELAASIQGVSGQFSGMASSSERYLEQSRNVLESLVKLSADSTGLLERLKATEEGLSLRANIA